MKVITTACQTALGLMEITNLMEFQLNRRRCRSYNEKKKIGDGENEEGRKKQGEKEMQKQWRDRGEKREEIRKNVL